MMRINKFLAQCGVASRRSADELVEAGRVTVNGETITAPGFQIDEQADSVTLDGKPVAPVEAFTYIVLNKPAGFLTSHSDPHHRKTVITLVKNVGVLVNPVGRLDLDTTGVLLMTNDGELAHRLTHPKFGVSKVYLATVAGQVTEDAAIALSKGIKLPDAAIGTARATIVEAGETVSRLQLELTEGRKREVKHLCRAVGFPVNQLTRLSFGGITAEGLKIGEWRRLTGDEIKSLKALAGLES